MKATVLSNTDDGYKPIGEFHLDGEEIRPVSLTDDPEDKQALEDMLLLNALPGNQEVRDFMEKTGKKVYPWTNAALWLKLLPLSYRSGQTYVIQLGGE